MEKFRLIQKDIPTRVFLDELELYLKERTWSTVRSELYEQQHTYNVNLRSPVLTKDFPNAQETPFHKLDGDTYPFFLKTYEFLEDFAALHGGELSRAMVVTLRPHTQVYRHFDRGSYYVNRDRYHIVLQSNGSRMTCDNEERVWHKGELWWFNNKLPHEAFNDSDEARIHIIFDILPQRPSLFKQVESFLLKRYFLLNHSV